jgi:hypothetical protein
VDCARPLDANEGAEAVETYAVVGSVFYPEANRTLTEAFGRWSVEVTGTTVIAIATEQVITMDMPFFGHRFLLSVF